MGIESTNPATGELFARHEPTSPDAVAEKIEKAHEAHLAWRNLPVVSRTGVLRAAAETLRAEKGELARLIAREMGKPVRQGRAEAEKCGTACDYYAHHAPEFLAPTDQEHDDARAWLVRAPLGVVLAVMPWNFPLWQVFRCAVPALVAGNAVVLKHASNVPGCALAIEDLLRRSGLPDGLFATLLIGSDRVDDVIAHERVRAVSLTGSGPAGRAVAACAGKHLKKTVLELGGSDPYLILEDADVEAAAETCVQSRLINAGQSCIAAKRFLVVDGLKGRFEEAVVEAMKRRRVGDPLEEDTDVGPMAREDLRDDLHEQVTKSRDAGARCLLGGDPRLDEPGWFYPPTVLTDVAPGMPAHDEELFGPAAAIVPVADVDEAVERANDSRFGLGAAVFTADAERGRKLAAEQLEAGCCFVNDFVKSDPRLPFGGVKDSGYGRELGPFGIREFVNLKTVVVRGG